MSEPAPPFDIGSARDAIRRIEERWNHAASPLSPPDIAAIYADDALFFGGLPDHFIGQAAVERYFSHYVGMLASIGIAFRDLHFTTLRDAILAQGFADFTFGLPDGRTTRARLRATLVVAPRENDWQILLHHFSPPPEMPPVPL